MWSSLLLLLYYITLRSFRQIRDCGEVSEYIEYI
nr:MAG TPA: hypothetical protein [Caudoviricetes sp.]